MTEATRVVTRRDVGRVAWDAFVDWSDEAWLWHRYDLQDALATWPGRSDASFALCAGDEPLAIVPVHFVEYAQARVLRLAALDSFGGPATAPHLAPRRRARVLDEVMGELRRLAGRRRTTRIDMTLAPLAPALRGERCPRTNPLLALGMENALTQTWIVDLRGGRDAAWDGMEGRARTTVRKAERAGLTVRVADGPRDLDEYYRLHLDTVARTGIAPHPKAYFERIWQDFMGSGTARVLVAEHAGRVVAARNFAVFKGASVCWTAASDAHALDLGANSLLQWRAMEWMVDAGIEWSETGEAFPAARTGKSQGLTMFKASFGGELYPIYRGRIELHQRLARRLYHVRRALRPETSAV